MHAIHFCDCTLAANIATTGSRPHAQKEIDHEHLLRTRQLRRRFRLPDRRTGSSRAGCRRSPRRSSELTQPRRAAIQLSLDAYGVTYAHLQDGNLQFETEAALQLDDGSMLTLRMPTRHSEMLAIHEAVCIRQGWCQAA